MLQYISKKTNAVYDYQFYIRLKEAPFQSWMEKSPPLDCREIYLVKIDQMLKGLKLNKLTGLDRFPQRHLINGTTQSFDEAYHRYANKRLRIFKGEYAYHKRVNPHFVFIEDGPLEKDDYIIASYPFCSTGDKHPLLDSILDQALTLDIPVEIDSAYLGTCYGLNLDYSHPAIKSVSFSLSKGMGLGDIRSGIRYSEYEDDYPIAQQNRYNHTVLLAAKIGIYMMGFFDFDYIPNLYRKHQESFCQDLNITPTPCVHLALGDQERFPEHIIDGTYYRLGIREAVKLRKNGKI